MLLTIDVGNTNITVGIYDQDDLKGSFRITTKSQRTSDELGILLCSLIQGKNIPVDAIQDVIISSVVPKIMHSLNNAIRKYFNCEAMIIGPGIKTGIALGAENPKEVGADRIVDAAAAYYLYGGPVLVIDFGTATTYDFVSAEGVFEYAITSPGIEICAQALWTQTAKLPEIEIIKPKSILAKNTITSMQAGLVYGYIGQCEYIIEQVKKELGLKTLKVISTGGLGRILYKETDKIDVYDPDLAFKGMKLIFQRNKK